MDGKSVVALVAALGLVALGLWVLRRTQAQIRQRAEEDARLRQAEVAAKLARQEERRLSRQQLPVRTEIEVLPADPPRPPLGLVMEERLGVGIRAPSPAKPKAKKKAASPPVEKPKRQSRKRRTRFDRIGDDD